MSIGGCVMKRALVALIAGTVLSGLAAAYASTGDSMASRSDDTKPSKAAPAKAKQKLAASD